MNLPTSSKTLLLVTGEGSVRTKFEEASAVLSIGNRMALSSRSMRTQAALVDQHGQVLRLAGEGKARPGALKVSTRCSNKLCVRHLSTRTRAEIMASVSRRWASGEASHLARISSKQVLLIRKLYTKGNVTQSALAERFGMSTSNMKRIPARRSWKHF
jgi:hypothetical protein